jgi:hypothetical protein
MVVTKLLLQGPNQTVAETCVDAQDTRTVDTSVDKASIESCTEASVGDQKSKSESSANNVSQLNLKPIDQKLFTPFTMENDCDLEGFFDELMGVTLKRGNTFYEFCEKENVSEEKQLIFMPNVSFKQ